VRPFALVRPPLAQALTLAPPLFGCAPHIQSTSYTKGVSSQPWCALYKFCLKPCTHCLTPCTLYHTSAPSSQATFSKIACALSFPGMHPQALAPLSSMIALVKLSALSLKPCALLISRNPCSRFCLHTMRPSPLKKMCPPQKLFKKFAPFAQVCLPLLLETLTSSPPLHSILSSENESHPNPFASFSVPLAKPKTSMA
jgi:hypothetical protein